MANDFSKMLFNSEKLELSFLVINWPPPLFKVIWSDNVVVPLTIPSNQQMSIVGELHVDSVLTIDGQLAFLN